jgi:hypothetical protein
MSNEELTNSGLKVYKQEWERLVEERQRTDLLIDAILTASSISLETVQNTRRLDFTHLHNAYSAYTQQDIDSMAFKIVDTTIRDLFFENEQYFQFKDIIYYDSECFEFLYEHPKALICITIPSASNINKDNVLKLNWGIITISRVSKMSPSISEHTIICQSDNIDYLRTSLANYLILQEDYKSDKEESTYGG